MREKNIKEYNPNVTALARTEDEIGNLLNNPMINNEDKVKQLSLLSATFEQRRPKIVNSKTVPVPFPIQQVAAIPIPLPDPTIAVAAPANTVQEVLPEEPLVIPNIIAQEEKRIKPFDYLQDLRLPVQYSNKLSDLLNIINANPHIICSSPKGELVINGNIIPDSNFKHSLRELYQHSKSNCIIGFGLLLGALNSLNISPNLISNSVHKAQYEQLQNALPPGNILAPYNILKQKGTGIKKRRKTLGPPGKRPRVLFVFED